MTLYWPAFRSGIACRQQGQKRKTGRLRIHGKTRLLVLFKEARVISPDLILEKFHLVAGMFSARAHFAAGVKPGVFT